MDLLKYLGVQQLQVNAQFVELKLQVTARHLQPHGILHGGMNAVLAETAASLGAQVALPTAQMAVGTQVITNHLRPVTAGKTLYVQATPIHRGKKIQLWQVKTLVANQVTSTSQVQLMIVPART